MHVVVSAFASRPEEDIKIIVFRERVTQRQEEEGMFQATVRSCLVSILGRSTYGQLVSLPSL